MIAGKKYSIVFRVINRGPFKNIWGFWFNPTWRETLKKELVLDSTDWLHKNGSPKIRHAKDQPPWPKKGCKFSFFLKECTWESQSWINLYPSLIITPDYRHNSERNWVNQRCGRTDFHEIWNNLYRPRSEGDNVLGSICPSICPYVRSSAPLLWLNQYQSKVFVCVSIISGRMRIIARMPSIGF